MSLRDLLLAYESSYNEVSKAIDEYSAARGTSNEDIALRGLKAAMRELEKSRKAVQRRVHEYAPQMNQRTFDSIWQE